MKTLRTIESLLDQLHQFTADELEDQDLDFKQWKSSLNDAVDQVIEMAVCLANGGGGTTVFGVADRQRGRQQALIGVPPEVDVNRLRQAVYDRTDPKITAQFESLMIPEGTGRLLVMHIAPGRPPYTDTRGNGTVRIGKDCKPLTGSIRRDIGITSGESDFSAEEVARFDTHLLSAAALESLRDRARIERAPEEILQLTDVDLLNSLGLIKNGSLTRAAVLLVGTEDAIRTYIPDYKWTFLQMLSDTDYGNRLDRSNALIVAVQRIDELLAPFNPITTYRSGLFHFEYRTWPELALREALMNAFCHTDLRRAGPILVKHYQDRLEISSHGGFIGGITADNILHHPPVARNPLLVEALTRLRLVNRSNLGISRMFTALLVEGKEPPVIRESGDSVTVIFFRREFDAAFRMFVADESDQYRPLSVDSLLILQYILKHSEIDTARAATLCQRSEREIRETFAQMKQRGYIEHGGHGRGSYWCMTAALQRRLTAGSEVEPSRRIDWDSAKLLILNTLNERERRGEPGLTNQDIRHLTRFDRNQVYRLMNELRDEYPDLEPPGRGRYARYTIRTGKG